MKLLIAPAKKMRADRDFLLPTAQPVLMERTAQLAAYLQGLSLEELKKLLACNQALAQEAFQNLREFRPGQGETPALLAYDGIQYKYMAPGVFTEGQLAYVQKHLRILSGLYGVLRPLDGVSPYRLEMQAKVRTSFCKNLYDFWGSSLADVLVEEEDTLVDLASEEYARAVRPWVQGRARFITCVFAEEVEPGRLVEKGVYVKMARGEMVRFAAEEGIRTPEGLREFRRLGYAFQPQRSSGDTYVFCRAKSSKP